MATLEQVVAWRFACLSRRDSIFRCRSAVLGWSVAAAFISSLGRVFLCLFADVTRRKCRLKFPFRQNRVISSYCVVVEDFPAALYETDARKLNVEAGKLKL